MAKEIAESSASDGALFLEEIPKKKVFQEVWMNKHELPPKKGRQLEAAEEGTLMGRLASRMASRDMIDELDMGPKGRSPEAKKAQIADDEYPSKLRIEGPAEKKELQVGKKIEKEHKATVENLKKNPGTPNEKAFESIAKDHMKEHKDYYDDKKGLPAMERKLSETANEVTPSIMPGMGLHQQTGDVEASNMSDPKPLSQQVREGNNMAQQGKKAGNIWNTMKEPKHEQQKSLKK